MTSEHIIKAATKPLPALAVAKRRAYDLASLRAMVSQIGNGHLSRNPEMGGYVRLAGAVIDAAIADAVTEVIADPDRVGPSQKWFFSDDARVWTELLQISAERLRDTMCDLLDELADAVRSDPSRVVNISTHLADLNIQYEGEYQQLDLAMELREASFEAAVEIMKTRACNRSGNSATFEQLNLFAA